MADESPVTSTPGGKYRKGNTQPLVRDLISFVLGSSSMGLPKKFLVLIIILSPLLNVPLLLRRHVILFFFILYASFTSYLISSA